MYEKCERPLRSERFHYIEENTSYGGQDWSSLVGRVLCQACYDRYWKRGNLEKPQNRLLSPSETRKCTNEKCGNIKKDSQLHQIEEGRISGGRDWSQMVGNVLCDSCYQSYLRGGTGRSMGTEKGCGEGAETKRSLPTAKLMPAESEERHTTARKSDVRTPEGTRPKRCTNELCDRPEESSQFYKIDEGRTTGGHNWGSIAGHLLCKACYNRFLRRGTLNYRAGVIHHQSGSTRLDSKVLQGEVTLGMKTDKCGNPNCIGDSSVFYEIDPGKKHGRHWNFISGNMLCGTCHQRMLGKTDHESDRIHREKPDLSGEDAESPVTKCSYEHCEKPDESIKFHTVEEGKNTSGQDWTSVAGWTLCNACYQRYCRTGSCKRQGSGMHHPGNGISSSSGSSSSGSSSSGGSSSYPKKRRKEAL